MKKLIKKLRAYQKRQQKTSWLRGVLNGLAGVTRKRNLRLLGIILAQFSSIVIPKNNFLKLWTRRVTIPLKQNLKFHLPTIGRARTTLLSLVTNAYRNRNKNQIALVLMGLLIISLLLGSISLTTKLIKDKQQIAAANPQFKRQLFGAYDYSVTSSNGQLTTSLGTDNNNIEMQVERGESQVKFAIPLTQPKVRKEDQSLVYETENKLVSVRYQALPDGIKEEIILTADPQTNKFTSTISLRKTEPRVTPDGQIVFVDQNNEYQFHILPPFAQDATGDVTYALKYQLVEKGQDTSPHVDTYTQVTPDPLTGDLNISRQLLGPISEAQAGLSLAKEYQLILEVDPAWMNDPARVYPIMIDPTVVHDTSAEFALGELNRVTDTGSGAAPVLETYYQETTADEHTVGLWHMNEASGNILDSSGNSNTGTVTGTTVVDGKINNGRSFNGSSDIITTTALGSSPTTETIELWINPSAKGTIVAECDNTSCSSYVYTKLSINADGTLIGHLWNLSGTLSFGTLTFGEWYHVAMTFDGNTLSGYLNGNLIGSKTGSRTSPGTLYQLFGKGNAQCTGGFDSCTSYFSGTMDEIKYSNIAHSAEEIKASASRRPSSIYTSEVIDLAENVTAWNSIAWDELGVATGDGETLYSSTDLVAQWNFNETSGTTADNAEGTAALDGTLNNFYGTTSQDQAHTATGGTITYADGYTIHTFTSSSTFTPSQAMNVETLIVAGGGGGSGSTWGGGGGGAGGLITHSSFSTTGGSGVTVTVGAGGAAGAAGSNSSFGALTAYGGGDGNTSQTTSTRNGGSGGGAGHMNPAGAASSSTQDSNNGGTGYGYGGGASVYANPYNCGSGGGAGAAGTTGGVGGAGIASSISGSSTYYAGGGGQANTDLGGNTAGGIGGGGAGNDAGNGVAGTANTGGGGGGSQGGSGGAGGSGIVIIRYPTAPSGWTANNKRWGAGALDFNGKNSYVSVGDNDSLSPSNITVETWVNLSSGTTQDLIAGKGAEYWIAYNSGGVGLNCDADTLGFALYISSVWTCVDSTFTPETGTWYHVVGTYDGSDIKLYINGKLEESVSSGSGFSNNATPFGIGGYDGTETYEVHGTIDSTRVYSRALTASEILSNYNVGNVEFQTRVGSTSNPNDGSWDAWAPITSETAIESFDGPFQYNTTDTGLVSYWPMDETADNTCGGGEDTCDFKVDNHGTAIGTTIVDGAFGKGRGFDGSSDYITVANESNFDFERTDSFSIEAWVKTSNTSTQRVFSKMSSSAPYAGYELLVESTGEVTLFLNNTWSTNTLVVKSIQVINDGNWHHIVGTYDGSSSASGVTIYIDGAADSTTTTYDTLSASILNNISLEIGGREGANLLWDGSIDEARIYNTELSASTIQQHYLLGSTNPDSLHPSTATTSGQIFMEGDSSEKIETGRLQIDSDTVALWHLDETGGTSAYLKDSTANANHGTPTGTSTIKGMSNQAREFNGTSDYVSISASADFDLQNLSIEAWVYSDDFVHNGFVFEKTTNGSVNTQYSCFFSSSDSLIFRTYNTTPSMDDLSITTSTHFKNGQWHHIACTYDGSSKSIYVNGVKVAAKSYSQTLQTNAAGTSIIGAYGSGTDYFFNGNIDELKISNIGRTAEEVAESYRLGRDHYINKTISSTDLSGKDSLPFYIAADRPGTYLDTTVGESAYANYQPDANTVGLWHLDDNRYKDSSGNGNDGTDSLYGIDYGIRSSNLTLIANQWNAVANNGEMDITCTGGDAACEIVTMDGATISTPSINYGVAMDETTTRTAYIMYSPSLSGQGITPFTSNSDNYIGIRYNSGWEYDRNGAWYSFTPNDSNIIIAYLTQGTSITNLIQQDFHMSQTQGKLGKGRAISDDNDYISIEGDLGDPSAMTLEMWLNKSNFDNGARYIADGRNGGNWWFIQDYASGSCGDSDGNICFDGRCEIPSSLLQSDAWHHVAVTENSTECKIYLDGQLVDVGTGEDPDIGADMKIGVRYTTLSGHFDGSIDEVRISDTIRSASEIRQTYEVGLRTHPITIDFAASGDSGNLVTSSGDYSFTVDATAYGLNEKGSNIYLGDKIIVRENYDGTEYIAQGTVTAVTPSTGAVTVVSWDAGSTFPSGGYTANADFFKWQREYWPIADNTLSTHMDAITNLTLRLTNGSESRTIWLDDLKSTSGYLTNKSGSTITSATGNRYFQYRAILTSLDEAVSASVTSVTLDYSTNDAPTAPTSLLTEDLTNPVGITDTTPEFSAIYNDPDSTDIANKYQIQVDDDSGFGSTIWDSGSSGTSMTNCNQDNRCADISYAGSGLTMGTTYYWRIKYWDDDDAEGAWSTGTNTFIATTAPTAPTTPYTEGTTNPSGITDTTPEFSAIHNDPDGDSADFYQIEVNTQVGFDGTSMWDSTKTAMTTTADSVRSPDISYAGTTLSRDGSTYYWRIKFWDTLGAEGVISATQNFVMNSPPNTPSLDVPTDTAGDQSPLPVLKTTGTDPDSDYLKYKIELCKDESMTVSCQTFSQVSSQTGWSGQDAQTGTAYTSGTQATYTVQSALDTSTTYYWKSYGFDPAGTDNWGSTQGTPYSFTTTGTPVRQSDCRISEAADDSQNTLIWTDVATNEDYYQVDRSTDGAAWSTLSSTIAANSESYVDSTIITEHTYYYRIAPYLTAGPTYGAWCYTETLTQNLGSFRFD